MCRLTGTVAHCLVVIPPLVNSHGVVCDLRFLEKGDLMSLQHVSGLIYAKFRTGPNKSFIPMSGTPGTNDLATLITVFMSDVNRLTSIDYEDYGHPHFREEVDLQQLRIAESSRVLSRAHL